MKTSVTRDTVLKLRAAGHTLRAIGAAHGISHEQVRKIEKSIVGLRERKREAAYKRLAAINAYSLYSIGTPISIIARKASVSWPMAEKYLSEVGAKRLKIITIVQVPTGNGYQLYFNGDHTKRYRAPLATTVTEIIYEVIKSHPELGVTIVHDVGAICEGSDLSINVKAVPEAEYAFMAYINGDKCLAAGGDTYQDAVFNVLRTRGAIEIIDTTL